MFIYVYTFAYTHRCMYTLDMSYFLRDYFSYILREECARCDVVAREQPVTFHASLLDKQLGVSAPVQAIVHAALVAPSALHQSCEVYALARATDGLARVGGPAEAAVVVGVVVIVIDTVVRVHEA